MIGTSPNVHWVVVSVGDPPIDVTVPKSSESGRVIIPALFVRAPSSGTSIVIVYSIVSPTDADHHTVNGLLLLVVVMATLVSVVYAIVALSETVYPSAHAHVLSLGFVQGVLVHVIVPVLLTGALVGTQSSSLASNVKVTVSHGAIVAYPTLNGDPLLITTPSTQAVYTIEFGT